MKKAILVFLCLLGLSYALRMEHQQLSASSPSAQKTAPSPPTMDPEAQAAYKRLFIFFKKQKDLAKTFSQGGQPNAKQIKKLMGFFVNDPFFQKQMLKEITASQENQWVGKLSQEAQVRYLKIIVKYSDKDMQNKRIQTTVVNELLKDKEIGPALRKKYGNQVNGQFLAQLGGPFQSNAQLHKHLKLYL